MDFLTIKVMIIFRKYILPLLFSFVLMGCFSDFEPDIESKPVVCLNSLIMEGEKIKVSVTRTWRWSEGNVVYNGDKGRLDLGIYDADVKLYVNGKYEETLKLNTFYYDGDAYYYNIPYELKYPWVVTGDREKYKAYEAEYIPVAGDLIRLEVNSEKFGMAVGEVEVPHSVEIKNVNYEVNGFNHMYYEDSDIYQFNLNATVRFSDPEASKDFYMFKTSSSGYNIEYDEDGVSRGENVSFYDRLDEPLFTEHVSALDHIFSETSGYSFFTDRQISGKNYPLHVFLEDVNYTVVNPYDDPEFGKGFLRFTLYSISKSYYDHVISVWVENDAIIGSLGSVGLAEPVFSSSNVSTGAGVVAAAAKYEYILPLKPIVEECLRE